MFSFEWFSCPDGITPNSGLTGPNNTGLGVRVFANGPGDLGSIPGRVIPKTQKIVLDASLLSTQHYKVGIKGKVEQSRKGVAPSPTHWCSSYRKGSLWVTLDYGRQLYLLIYIYIYIYIYSIIYIYIYIYIYICVCVRVCVCVCGERERYRVSERKRKRERE